VDLFRQFSLGPVMPTDRLNIPETFFGSLAAFKDDHILRPADFHGLFQHLRVVRIRPEKLPHPTEIPRGEPCGISVCFAEIFSGGDSGTFLRPSTDESAKLAVQLHLRQ